MHGVLHVDFFHCLLKSFELLLSIFPVAQSFNITLVYGGIAVRDKFDYSGTSIIRTNVGGRGVWIIEKYIKSNTHTFIYRALFNYSNKAYTN